MSTALMFLFAETGVHAGGSESDGTVDLPIQREQATGLPVIWGESNKGALREFVRTNAKCANPLFEPGDEVLLFGSPPPKGSGGGELTPGAIDVIDARLVALPVVTFKNTFAWATSPLLLSRLKRLAHLAGTDDRFPAAIPEVHANSASVAAVAWQGTIAVADHRLEGVVNSEARSWASDLAAHALPSTNHFDYVRAKMATDLLIVSDSTMGSLARSATDITARVQLRDDAKIVEHGPWFVEYLPSDTLLTRPLTFTPQGVKTEPQNLAPARDRLFAALQDNTMVVGGQQSVGKGLVWTHIVEGLST